MSARWEDVEVTQAEDCQVEAVVSMRCSNCHRYHNEVYFYGNPLDGVNYCPRCGEKMEA